MNKLDLMLEQYIVLTKQIEDAKKLYEQRDQIVMTLKEQGFTTGQYGDQILTLKDNFAEKNTAWRMAAVNRFEIKITKDKS